MIHNTFALPVVNTVNFGHLKQLLHLFLNLNIFDRMLKSVNHQSDISLHILFALRIFNISKSYVYSGNIPFCLELHFYIKVVR